MLHRLGRAQVEAESAHAAEYASTCVRRSRRPTAAMFLLAIVGGVAIAAAFLRFSLWPIAWIAFVPILVAVFRCENSRTAAIVGFVAGLATNVPAFYWLVDTIHRFGGFPLWLSALFYGGLSAFSALQFVLFAVALRYVGPGPVAIVPACLWVALELWFPNLFPWRLANSQRDVTALLQVGEVTGPYGLSFVMMWVAAAVALAADRGIARAGRALAGSLIAVAAVLLFGVVRVATIDRRLEAASEVRIGVVQGNLAVQQKNDVHYFETNLATYRDLTAGLGDAVDVVIWPESVITEPIPRTLSKLPQSYVNLLGIQTPLLTGALTYGGTPDALQYYNSIVGIDARGRILGVSDKIILMPFGEYMPLGSMLPFLKRLSPMTGDFAAGVEVVPLDVPEVGRFAPLNCYEDLLAPIARRAMRTSGSEVLFAVANDAWFGPTASPYQHEALALWRAIENRRYLVRVTNTGVTDVIDPAGRVLLRLPLFEPSARVVGVRKLRGMTFYTRFGDVFAWLATVASVAALVVARRRQ